MENITEKNLKAEKEIKRLDELILNRSEEFIGKIEDFTYFLDCAIRRELHALTTNDYIGNKPTFNSFDDTMNNIDILKDIFKFMEDKQMKLKTIEKNLLIHQV